MQENGYSNRYPMYAGIIQQEKHFSTERSLFLKKMFQDEFWVYCGPTVFAHMRIFFLHITKKKKNLKMMQFSGFY